jgi:hypothetical protein
MKALIRLYRNHNAVFEINEFSTEQINEITKSVDEWLDIYKEDAYSNFLIGFQGVAFGIDNEFLYHHGSKMIQIYPMDVNDTIHIEFHYAGDEDWICYCREVDCPGGCGVLECGCIDVCRGLCGNNDYW